jgi:glutaconyl-CoA/methylmalonyl-CoA decarboxylase subunit gamma
MKSYKITVNGQSYDVTVEELGAASQAKAPARAAPSPQVAAPSQGAAASPATPAAPTGAPAGAGAAQVKAPIPGTLRSFKVKVGQSVKAGEVILILEAMKMENEIVAPVGGVVTSLAVGEGASVNSGDLLATIG